MSLEPHEFDIDWEGRRCVVQELPAKDARQVARRVVNAMGAALKETAKPGIEGLEIQVAMVGAIGAVFEKLDEPTLEWITTTFMKQTLVERESGTEEFIPLKEVEALVFGGGAGLKRWARWLRFSVEMTCGDFFADAFASLREKTAKGQTVPLTTTKAASASPTTSPRSGSFTG
jgi:hypothetical protein